MADTIDIFTLKINMDETISETAKLAEETARLKIVMDATNKSTEATAEEQVKAKAAYSASNQQLKENERELAKMEKIRGQEIKTVQQGRNALAVINKEWAKQASLYGANSAQANKLADQTLELRTRLKELEKGVGDNTRNVGNYSDGITEALGKNNLFARATANITEALKVAQPVYKGVKSEVQAASTQIKNAAVGTEAMTKAQKAAAITSNILSGALKILKVALISTGIGAIVVLLGSLVAYFTSTQKGADQVSTAMAGLGAAFDVIIDRLSTFGGALAKIFSGDITGGIKDMEGAFSGIGDEIQREVGLALELEKATQALADKEISLIGVQEQRRLKSKELELAAKDELKTASERAELLKQAQDLQGAIYDDEIALATERARISQEQIDLGESTREQLEENARLQAEVTKQQTTATERQITLESEKQSLQKRAREEEKAAAAAARAVAQKETDQALKDNETRLQIFIEQNKGKTAVLEEGLVYFSDVMNRELEIEKERYEAGKINATEYELAQLQIKNDALQAQADLTAKFATEELEREKEAKAIKDEEELLAAEEAKEKAIIEWEAKQETRIAEGEWYFDILRTDLAAQQSAEIAQAEKVGADTALINKKYAAINKQIKQDEQNAKLSAVASTFGSVAQLLGEETAAGKAAAVAEATISTYLGAQKAYTSLVGIPVYGPALAAVAAGVAVAGGLLNVQKILSTPKPNIKAEKGALIGIGGKRHSSGGTKFTGEDGTMFEAERGELIGVMNRRAAASFMQFNNEHGGVVGKTFGNHFADGGIVTRGITTSANNMGIDYDLLASKLAEANAALPAPKVAVVDINDGQGSYAEVEQGATV